MTSARSVRACRRLWADIFPLENDIIQDLAGFENLAGKVWNTVL